MIAFPHLWKLVALLGLVLCVAAYGKGRRDADAAWEARQAARAAAEARQDLATSENNVREVIKYVDRIKTVERNVPVVRERVVRLCDEGPRWAVHGAGELATAAETDAPDRRADLAAELVASRENQEQCRALMAVVRPQAHASAAAD